MFIQFLLLLIGTSTAQMTAQTNAPSQLNNNISLEEFRSNVEDSIKKNWLVVVGLEWLKPGSQILGVGEKVQIKLPGGSPRNIANLVLKDKTVTLTVLEDQGLKIDNQVAHKGQSYVLKSDTSEQKTVAELGTLQMYIIERPKGVGLRIKDSESKALKNFKGIQWWENKSNYILKGRWKAITPERTIMIPDVQGEISEEKISGYVEFDFQGKTHSLYPTKDGNKLFFVFKDLTSGKSSYGPGRFLNAELQKDGTVTMDFNRATNPPCAFINFATCPLPPIENYLKVAIEAGAKAPPKH